MNEKITKFYKNHVVNFNHVISIKYEVLTDENHQHYYLLIINLTGNQQIYGIHKDMKSLLTEIDRLEVMMNT